MPEIDTKEEIFVRLDNELELRTDLLESAKLTTYLLKNYEKINQIYKQKKKEKLRLNMLLNDINSTLNSLDLKDLSWFNAPAEKKQTEKVVKKEDTPKISKDKLTLDLEEIEKKLNSLKF